MIEGCDASSEISGAHAPTATASCLQTLRRLPAGKPAELQACFRVAEGDSVADQTSSMGAKIG
jgi:hypothetical protein